MQKFLVLIIVKRLYNLYAAQIIYLNLGFCAFLLLKVVKGKAQEKKEKEKEKKPSQRMMLVLYRMRDVQFLLYLKDILCPYVRKTPKPRCQCHSDYNSTLRCLYFAMLNRGFVQFNNIPYWTGVDQHLQLLFPISYTKLSIS